MYPSHPNRFQQPRAARFFLRDLIADLILENLSVAHHHQSTIENHVAASISLPDNLYQVKAVIDELLHTVVANSKRGDIHILASMSRSGITLEIQDRNNYNGYALAFSIGTIHPDAALAGGYLSITGQQQRVATVSFKFPAIAA